VQTVQRGYLLTGDAIVLFDNRQSLIDVNATRDNANPRPVDRGLLPAPEKAPLSRPRLQRREAVQGTMRRSPSKFALTRVVGKTFLRVCPEGLSGIT